MKEKVMEMSLNEWERTLDYLDLLEETGHKWVVIDQNADKLDRGNFFGFFSAGKAHEFCENSNAPSYFENEEYSSSTRYSYLPLVDFKAMVGPKIDDASSQVQRVVTIEELLVQKNLAPLPGQNTDLIALFNEERFVPMLWRKQISPLKDCDQFSIVEHTHEGGLIYEVGHAHRVLATTPHYSIAYSLLEITVDDAVPPRTALDFNLVGQIKGATLKLDMEGFPEQGTGITTVTVNNQYDMPLAKKDFVWHHLHDPDQLCSIDLYVLVRYNPVEGKLNFYDEQLNKVEQSEVKSLPYPNHFLIEKININNEIMKETNFKYLKDQVKFTGFGETLESGLKTKMLEGASEFYLTYEPKFGREDLQAALHFKQSEQGNYYFNSYDLLMKDQGAELKQNFKVTNAVKLETELNGQTVERTYNNTFTLKEAFNLMEGRSVNKDIYQLHKVEKAGHLVLEPNGKVNNTWVSLNFKETDDDGNFKKIHRKEDYKFDLEAALREHPIKELSNKQDKDNLIQSLKRGNRQSVTFVIAGENERRFIQADPQFKSIRITDNNPSLKENEGQDKGQSQDKKAKQEIGNVNAADDGAPPSGKKQRPRKSKGIS